MLKPQALGIHQVLRQTVEHKGVVGVGAVAELQGWRVCRVHVFRGHHRLLAFAEVAALPFTVRERPPWHTLLYLEKRLPVYLPAHGGSEARSRSTLPQKRQWLTSCR